MRQIFKTLFFCTAICVLPFTVMAQVTIGSVTPPASFALLELCTSNVKSGLRLPQLTAAEAANIRAKVADIVEREDADEIRRVGGLMYYNVDTGCIEYWNEKEKAWRYLCGEESVDALIDRITELTKEVDRLETRIKELEDFSEVSTIYTWTVRSTNHTPHPASHAPGNARPGFPAGAGGNTGLQVHMLRTGSTFVFWSSGQMTASSLASNMYYYLLASGDSNNYALGISEVLSWFQGTTTIGTMWIHRPDGAPQALPLYINESGIFINSRSTYSNLQGATMGFKQTLILVDTN